MPKFKASLKPGVECFPCEQCGAILKYAPGTEHQVFEYCGFENHIEPSVAPIQEYDLQQALRQLAQPQTETVKAQIHCDECGAGFQFDSHIHAGECPFCGTPIVTTTAQAKPIQPKSLLPFGIGETEAKQRFHRWIAGLWFAPNAVKKFARSDVYYVTVPVQVVQNGC